MPSFPLTNEKGHLGLAIDLVDALDQVLGEDLGGGGDRQFRMYVYLCLPEAQRDRHSKQQP